MKSMKIVDWKPNQEVITSIVGAWNKMNNGWTVECTFTIGDNVHYMAKFQRKGKYGMQDNFSFSSFIEFVASTNSSQDVSNLSLSDKTNKPNLSNALQSLI